MDPPQDVTYGIAHGLTAASVAAALESLQAAAKDAAAVLITSPTYYGACCDIASIAEVLPTVTCLALSCGFEGLQHCHRHSNVFMVLLGSLMPL